MRYIGMFLIVLSLFSCYGPDIEVRQTFSYPAYEEPEKPDKMYVWVYGEVKKAGRYEVPIGYSLSRLIAMSGSLTEDAKSSVKIRRYYVLNGNHYVQDTWIDLVTYGGEEEMILENNDEVHVSRWGKGWYQIFLGWTAFMAGVLSK